MKMGKYIKRKQQQQQSGSGRAVLVTFYVTKPRRNGGGASAASSSRNVHRHRDVHHHHHHHYHHHHLHGGSNEARRGSENGRTYDRRADLLEYSRQLRATAATSTPPPLHPEPLPPRRNIKTVGAVRHDDGHRQPQPPARDERRMGRRRLERARSQQQIRQRCLGGGDWNWKRVIMLVLPCHNNTESSTRSRNRRDDKSDDKKNNSNAKAWPAAVQLVSKLKVDRRSRRTSSDDNGLVKKLFSMFRQQSRSSR